MVKHVLIRIPNWLGDAVMATAAIHAYHERHPEEEITLLGRPSMLAVFSSSYNPYNLLPYDRDETDAGWSGFHRMSGMLRTERYDTGFLLTNSFSSAMMFYLGQVKERIGYAAQFRSFLLTEALPKPNAPVHQAQEYAYLMLREENLSLTPFIRISPEERERARQVLEENESLGRMRIGLAPGAAYGPAKQWPEERFVEFARECIRTWDVRVLVFGAKKEEPLALRIQQAVGEGVCNLTGQTTLRQLLALLQQCKVVVANDSGIMHAATAVQTPVTGIFGSTDPGRTSPLGKNTRVLYKKISCSPCFERTCLYQHYDCLKLITVPMVVEKVEELLSL